MELSLTEVGEMARVRPAVPCSAKRTNGQPCRAYAIVGGRVCRGNRDTRVVTADQLEHGTVTNADDETVRTCPRTGSAGVVPHHSPGCPSR